MTIIISLVTSRYVIQVSDMRMSWIDPSTGELFYEDDLVKSILITTQDSFSIMSYTGIARDSKGVRTDDWVIKKISSMKPTTKRLTEIMSNLATEATKWFTDISRAPGVDIRHLHHSFLVSGWYVNNRPFYFLVSNCEDLNLEKNNTDDPAPWISFRTSFYCPRPGKNRSFKLKTVGDFEGLPLSKGTLVGELAQIPGAKPHDIVNIMTKSILQASEVTQTVSPQCMSTVIERGGNAHCGYHNKDGPSVDFLPHYVGLFNQTHIKVAYGEAARREIEKLGIDNELKPANKNTKKV